MTTEQFFIFMGLSEGFLVARGWGERGLKASQVGVSGAESGERGRRPIPVVSGGV